MSWLLAWFSLLLLEARSSRLKACICLLPQCLAIACDSSTLLFFMRFMRQPISVLLRYCTCCIAVCTRWCTGVPHFKTCARFYILKIGRWLVYTRIHCFLVLLCIVGFADGCLFFSWGPMPHPDQMCVSQMVDVIGCSVYNEESSVLNGCVSSRRWMHITHGLGHSCVNSHLVQDVTTVFIAVDVGHNKCPG